MHPIRMKRQHRVKINNPARSRSEPSAGAEEESDRIHKDIIKYDRYDMQYGSPHEYNRLLLIMIM